MSLRSCKLDMPDGAKQQETASAWLAVDISDCWDSVQCAEPTWRFNFGIIEGRVSSKEQGVGRRRLVVLEEQIHACAVVQPERGKEGHTAKGTAA